MKLALEWRHERTGQNIIEVLISLWQEQEIMRGGVFSGFLCQVMFNSCSSCFFSGLFYVNAV